MIESEQRFLADVADHKLTVLRDDGLYRHLRFRRSDTYCMGFDILTWPGYLAVTGDMGEYVFQRLEDMFVFFRNPQGKLVINPSYWSEKCQASDTRGKIREFSQAMFRAAVEEHLTYYCDGDEELRAELAEEVEYNVYSILDDHNEQGVRQALDNIEHDGNTVFQDFWEISCQEYTFHFVWICYAIAWGVIQYDALTSEVHNGK